MSRFSFGPIVCLSAVLAAVAAIGCSGSKSTDRPTGAVEVRPDQPLRDGFSVQLQLYARAIPESSAFRQPGASVTVQIDHKAPWRFDRIPTGLYDIEIDVVGDMDADGSSDLLFFPKLASSVRVARDSVSLIEWAVPTMSYGFGLNWQEAHGDLPPPVFNEPWQGNLHPLD